MYIDLVKYFVWKFIRAVWESGPWIRYEWVLIILGVVLLDLCKAVIWWLLLLVICVPRIRLLDLSRVLTEIYYAKLATNGK